MGKSPTVLLGVIRFADLATIIGLAVIGYWLRHGFVDMPGRYWLAAAICGLLTMQVFQVAKLYDYSLIGNFVSQTAKLTAAWAFVGLALIALVFFSKTAEDFSRVWAAAWLSSCYFGFLLIRLAANLRVEMLMRQGKLTRRVAVIGAGDRGRRLLQYLQRLPGPTGIELVGVFDDRQTRIPKDEVAGVPIRGTTTDLIALCRRETIDLVIVALPWNAEHRLMQIMADMRQVPVDLQLAPEQIGFQLADRPMINLAGVPMLTVFEKPMSGWNRLIKGIEDRVLASIIAVAAAPLMLIIAAAIKFDSPGPVLFRQKRLGFNNNVITVYKFRTMYDAAEDDKFVPQATPDDPRVTRFGALLRRTSLDELPQLINVLNGSMSLVGPRPHALVHNEAFAASVREYYSRHRVKPGITGWAQVHGLRGETNSPEKLEKRVEYDLYYIDNWSLLLDLKIILMTFAVGLVNKHAY